MKNEEALQTVKEERNSLHTIKRWKANWTSHTLCMNCFLKHVTEVKEERIIEQNGRQGRCKQLLDEGNRYWKLKEEALDRSFWRIRF